MRTLAARLPSPAMAVALVALFAALGGTGYAAIYTASSSASTAAKKPVRHADAAQDQTLFTKLFNKSISKARVAFATTAGSASTAATATHAKNADNATNAVNATHASTADNASSAGSATHASTANNATNATTAASATAVASITYVHNDCTVAAGIQGPCMVQCPVRH